MAVLCMNAGSSSLKFALFETASGARPALCLRGQIEHVTEALSVKAASPVALEAQGCPT